MILWISDLAGQRSQADEARSYAGAASADFALVHDLRSHAPHEQGMRR